MVGKCENKSRLGDCVRRIRGKLCKQLRKFSASGRIQFASSPSLPHVRPSHAAKQTRRGERSTSARLSKIYSWSRLGGCCVLSNRFDINNLRAPDAPRSSPRLCEAPKSEFDLIQFAIILCRRQSASPAYSYRVIAFDHHSIRLRRRSGVGSEGGEGKSCRLPPSGNFALTTMSVVNDSLGNEEQGKRSAK